MKKLIVLLLAGVLLLPLCACGEKEIEETKRGTDFSQGTKCVVAYNSSGYGDSWLKESAKAFEEAYAAEGYEIELRISYAYENNAALEIGKGAEKMM